MKLYLDESVSVILATILAQHGIDCQTALQADHLGASDEYQLRYATESGRAIFTHDTRDYLRLAGEWAAAGRSHGGIILAHQVPFRTLVRRFRVFLMTHRSADLTNQVLWLPAPTEEP